MNVWEFIVEKYAANNGVVLLYVLHSKGSSPGRQGFSMAVAADGTFFGSIGGGMMEYKFVEMAKARLASTSVTLGVYRQIHDKESGKNQSGMICSGEQTIFLYELQQKDIPFIFSLLTSLANNKNGSLTLTHDGISFSDDIPSDNFTFQQTTENDFVLVEKTGYKNILHIIGGGHCALALSRLMSNMDFYIHVYDERDGLNTMAANSHAHEQHLVNSYASLDKIIQPGENVYVVIMTFGYRSDDIAFKALQHQHFRYIGLLGSKKKIGKMFSGAEDILSTIHSPVGIPIKSQTPEEIAISIAAEIILVKNKDQ